MDAGRALSLDHNDLRHMEYVKDDGGRAAAGYRGETRDCVARAIAIAAKKPYQEVYDALTWNQNEYAERHRGRVARRIRERGGSARTGVFKEAYRPYLESLGFSWVPTMQIGSGCKVHLRGDELPKGRIIAKCSRHLVAVIDGMIHDTHDSSRGGTRCVYGYYEAPR